MVVWLRFSLVLRVWLGGKRVLLSLSFRLVGEWTDFLVELFGGFGGLLGWLYGS